MADVKIHVKESMCKVCSISFEPPESDLCSECHVYPLTMGVDYFNIINTEQLNQGAELHNLMNISKPLIF